jgi:hypothetical protein
MAEQPYFLKIKVVWWMQLMLIAPSVLFVFPLIAFFQRAEGVICVLPIVGLFAVLGLINIFANVVVTENDVTVNVFYGRFRIRWDEVQKIIARDGMFALLGNDKRVVLSIQYMDANRHQMFEYFSQQIEKRKIEITQEDAFPFTRHNSRVRE